MTKKHRVSKGENSEDQVRTYLKSRGVSHDLIAKGLPGAVARWESVAKSVDGYAFTLDDWLNDLDLRDIIAGALSIDRENLDPSIFARVDAADHKFREATIVTDPVWGAKVAAAHSHNPSSTWWYFRIPRKPGRQLKSDIEAAGLD